MKRVALHLAILVIIATANGCTSTRGYLADRGNDAADIQTIAGGLGAGAKVRVGPFAFGLIYHQEAIGLRGGALYEDLSFDEGIGDCHLAFLGAESFTIHDFPESIWEKRKKNYHTPYLVIPIPIACPSSQNIETFAYSTQIETVIGLGPSVRIGVNPGELLDFLLGWGTLDILHDDLNKIAEHNLHDLQSGDVIPQTD